MKNEIQTLKSRAKEVVAEGNQRQLVFRNKSGESLFEVSLTIAVAVAIVLLITGVLSFPLVIIAGVLGMLFGIRVELRHNVLQDENTVVIDS